VWYVQKAVVRILARGETFRRDEWEFEEFRANRDLNPHLFTLAAFNLQTGDNVIDRRSGQMTIHAVDPVVLAETKLDDMVRQMEEMPLHGNRPRPRLTSRTVLIWAVNALAVAIILSVWCVRYLYRRRSRRVMGQHSPGGS
jgi:hypothetical protein